MMVSELEEHPWNSRESCCESHLPADRGAHHNHPSAPAGAKMLLIFAFLPQNALLSRCDAGQGRWLSFLETTVLSQSRVDEAEVRLQK